VASSCVLVCPIGLVLRMGEASGSGASELEIVVNDDRSTSTGVAALLGIGSLAVCWIWTEAGVWRLAIGAIGFFVLIVSIKRALWPRASWAVRIELRVLRLRHADGRARHHDDVYVRRARSLANGRASRHHDDALLRPRRPRDGDASPKQRRHVDHEAQLRWRARVPTSTDEAGLVTSDAYLRISRVGRYDEPPAPGGWRLCSLFPPGSGA
jgi:hypothetical protein